MSSKLDVIGDRGGWYRHLADTAQDVILVHDMTGKVLFLNRAGMALGGYDETVLGKLVLDVLDPGEFDKAKERMAARIAGDRRVFRYETSFRNKERDRIPVEVITNPLVEEDRLVGVLVIGRDISERKRAEQEREQLEEALRRSKKLEALGRLAGGVAHDFNNVLTVINGYAQLLLESLDEGAPQQRAAAAIKRAADNAERLTDQLLTFGRRQAQSPEALCLNDLLDGAEEVLGHAAGAKRTLSISKGDGLWAVEADRAQMQSVVFNLVTNAADAMADGGTVVVDTSNEALDEAACRARPNASPGRYVVLSVTDTGCGMSDDLAERIFEPFFTTKADTEGTGLGLATVYGVITQSGGFVDVETVVGEGSTFRIALPAVEGSAVFDGPEPPPSPRPERRPRGSGTILLVDDDELVRALAEEILTEGGYRVLTASNGGEAFLLFRKHADEIELLVTDVVMPQMSGVELHEALAEQRQGLPVLYVSGRPESAARTGSPVPPGAPLLRKPFDADDLLAAADDAVSSEVLSSEALSSEVPPT